MILRDVSVHLRQGPVDAGQLCSWRRLWQILLTDSLKNTKAANELAASDVQHGAIPPGQAPYQERCE